MAIFIGCAAGKEVIGSHVEKEVTQSYVNKSITSDFAEKLINAAEKKAKETVVPMVIAINDVMSQEKYYLFVIINLREFNIEKYVGILSKDEQEALGDLTYKGIYNSQKILNAQILLRFDESKYHMERSTGQLKQRINDTIGTLLSNRSIADITIINIKLNMT